MANEVLYETKGHVAVITLNRPEALNAINPTLGTALREAFLRYRSDPQMRCAVLTGAGRAFCAGADLKYQAGQGGEYFSNLFWNRYETIFVECYKPVIAAINGYCYAAAMNLMFAATDIRVCSTEARFCYAEVLRGFSGAGPALAWLPRSVPFTHAMKWLLTGEVFGPEEARRVGMVNDVVAPDRLMATALAMAEEIAALPPLAVRAIKESVLRGLGMDMVNATHFAHTLSTITRQSDDAQEGPRAFKEKRRPQYKGR